jgi:hypothetical protein
MKPVFVLAIALLLFLTTVSHLDAQPDNGDAGDSPDSTPPMQPDNPPGVVEGGCIPDEQPRFILPDEFLRCGKLVGHYTDLDGARHKLTLQFHRVWPKDAPAAHIEAVLVIGEGRDAARFASQQVSVDSPRDLSLAIEVRGEAVVALHRVTFHFDVQRTDDGGRVTVWGANDVVGHAGTFHMVGHWTAPGE